MSARILIIEDNQANMDLLTYLLQAFGHRPLGAADGASGVEMARRERPDLILCDLHLPKLDGYGVVAQLRADPATRAIPVLAASALPVDDGCAALRRAGFSGCLPKSLEPDSLLPALESFLPAHLRSGPAPAGQTGQADAAPAASGSANATGSATAASPATAAGATAAQILLLDAAPENAGLAASILSHCGYGVHSAANPAQAAVLASHPLDLVLCDLGLHEAHRLDFLADSLELVPDLPLLVIRPDDDDDIARLTAGRHHQVLTHPLDPQQLVAAIETVLASA